MKKNLPYFPYYALRETFSPGAWTRRAAAFFGCSIDHVVKLANGRRRLTKRHLQLLETYALNKFGSRQSEVSRLTKQLERQLLKAADGWHASRNAYRAALLDIAKSEKKSRE